MAISFGPIASGLPKDIVQQIMKAERAPVEQIEARKGNLSAKKDLVSKLLTLTQEIKALVDKNKNPEDLRELKVMSNEEIVDISLDKKIARPGSYTFEVKKMAQKSGAISSGFADKAESYIGVGFIQYTLPNGETKDVYIGQNESSLEGVAKVINNSDMGITASVVNDGTGTEKPWRVILSLKETGDDYVANFPHFYFVDGEDDFYLESERKAHDALVALDGFEIETQESKSSDLIPGATITYKKAKPGEEFTIEIVEDVKAITEKIKAILEKINEVLKFIQEQNTLDSKSDTKKTLGGDLVLQTLESKIRSAMFTPVPTQWGMRRGNDLGITFNKKGFLDFDEKKFENVLSQNYQQVAEILTGMLNEDNVREKGLINSLDENLVASVRYPDGILQSRKNTFESGIKQIDRQIESKERMLEQKERNLKNKFARLEETISRIKGQGAGLQALGAQVGQMSLGASG